MKLLPEKYARTLSNKALIKNHLAFNKMIEDVTRKETERNKPQPKVVFIGDYR